MSYCYKLRTKSSSLTILQLIQRSICAINNKVSNKELSMFRLYIGGASGSGKTTISKSVAQLLGIPYFTGSSIMMTSAKVQSRDDLARLPKEYLDNLRKTAFRDIYEQHPVMILEGHYYFTDVDAEYFSALALIEASGQTILGYHLNDPARKRTLEQEAIEKDIVQTRGRAINASRSYNLPLTVVRNDGDVQEATEAIATLLPSISHLR